ncbi:MAG TPA: MFS transporter [Gaiellaceae bacterium]|nr:MFS transporter [Gaiellaceae bacterium]
MARAPRASAEGRLVTAPLLLAIFSTFGGMLSLGVLLPVLPRFAEGPLDAGGVGIGLSVGASSITAVVAQPFVGRLGDAYGRRLLVVGAPLLLALVGLAYVPAESLAAVIALRLVAGVGEGALLVGGATVVTDLAPAERRGQAVSYFTLAPYGGVALGPLLGELVLGGERYDAVWTCSAALAAAAALLGTLVPETRPERSGAPARRGLVHGAALAPGIVLACALLGFGGFNAFVALYALELGLDGGGLVFLEFAGIVVAVRLFGARIPDLLGAQRCATLALVLLATAFAAIALWDQPAGLFVGTAVMALGQSLAYPALVTLAVGRAPAEERGAVIGTFSAFVDLAIFGGAAGLGAVVSAAGYQEAFLTASVAAALGLPLLAGIARPRPVPVAADDLA